MKCEVLKSKIHLAYLRHGLFFPVIQLVFQNVIVILLAACGCGRILDVGYEEEVFPPEGGDALNRLPKEAVDAPSQQAFKVRLDVALGSLGCWLVTLHIAGGGWNSTSIVGLFNPGHSTIL